MSLPWYQTWFNTPYYHDLYQHRDLTEARGFIESLCQNLGVNEGEIAIDMACGRGRHAQVLANQGLETLGIDLSPESIAFANQFAHEGLEFRVGNMLEPLQTPPADWVFNLFTSFGYFEDDKEDIGILENMKRGLNKDGFFVFDFLNAKKVKLNLIATETKTVDRITFNIKREIKNGFIFKHISFSVDGKNHAYTERVKYLDLDKMTSFFEKVGFTITNVFGNYHLNTYEDKTSDRLIIIAK